MKLLVIIAFMSLYLAPAQVFAKLIHFSDNNGPSKETGDCSGLSVWLELDIEKAQFVSGEIAEFEGGCKEYRKEIIQINHNPKTGTISFYAPSVDANYLKFEGTYYYEFVSLQGTKFSIFKKNLKRVNNYSRDISLSQKKQLY